jgi:ABC-type glutathione transport system ATPase component
MNAPAPAAPSADAPPLELSQLSLRYPGSGRDAPPVVREVSLRCDAGRTLGLVGESGSGKTTLARAIFGMVPAASGTVRVFGREWAELDAAERKRMRRRVQMVFQDPYASLNPMMTIGDAIAEPLVVHGLGDRSARAARVGELLGLVGLPADFAARHPAQLSGGQRQRVAIARALAPGPELLVCDEPVSALDVSVQAQILNLLKSLQQRLGLAMLFISHDLAVIRFIAHAIAVIQEGRIVEQGPRAQVLDAPSHPYTRALFAAGLTRSIGAATGAARIQGDPGSGRTT